MVILRSGCRGDKGRTLSFRTWSQPKPLIVGKKSCIYLKPLFLLEMCLNTIIWGKGVVTFSITIIIKLIDLF